MKHVSNSLAWFILTPVMITALIWPALWNGFPLIYADTGGYLARPFEGTLTIGRSAFYGAFLAAAMPFDFWPAIIVQAALTVWLVVLILRTHGFGRRPGVSLVIVLALAGLTALPWYVAQLLPDAMVGLAILASYLLAFRRDALRPLESLGLVVLVAACIASHMAILALCLVLLAWFAMVRWLGARIRLPRPRLGAASAGIALGIALCLVSNFIIAGQLAFTPGGTTFIFGRFIQDGLVARYLDEHCPDRSVRLCDYRAELPTGADDWIWGNDSPLHKLGGWDGYSSEARRIILETLRLYPGQHLIEAASSTLSQLFAFRTAISVTRWDNADVIATFDRLLPAGSLVRFHAARQQRELWDVDWLNLIHIPVALISMACLLLPAALGRYRRDAFAPAFCASVAVALVANAVICGVLSNPNVRYQSRIVPLASLAAAVAMLGGRREPREKPLHQIG